MAAREELQSTEHRAHADATEGLEAVRVASRGPSPTSTANATGTGRAWACTSLVKPRLLVLPAAVVRPVRRFLPVSSSSLPKPIHSCHAIAASSFVSRCNKCRFVKACSSCCLKSTHAFTPSGRWVDGCIAAAQHACAFGNKGKERPEQQRLDFFRLLSTSSSVSS